MDPSVIFLIAAGAIILFGRTINRVAEKSEQEANNNTTPKSIPLHEINSNENTFTRQDASSEDPLAGTLIAQILSEQHQKEIQERMLRSINQTQTHSPKFVSNASVAPKPKKQSKVKPQPKNPKKETKVEESRVAPNSEIINDFDLKKAIIFSEILKPKFDE